MGSLTVKGMSCGHCKQTVTKAVESVSGVQNVTVNLETGLVTWTESTPVDVSQVKEAIEDAGFDIQSF